MSESEFNEFGTLLDGVCALLSRGVYVPSAPNTALFFRSLSRFDLADVRTAFDAHVADPQRGRFVPVPADLIAQLEGLAADDGRLGADEAWAIAVQASDEAQTVVWTDDIAQAWGVARTVMDVGDDVGARVAFRDAYNRIVAQARRDRVLLQWTASLGFDLERREVALREAVSAGRIESHLLPAPRTEQTYLALVSSPLIPDEARANLALLRERLVARVNEPSLDVAAREETARLQRETAERVAEYRRASS